MSPYLTVALRMFAKPVRAKSYRDTPPKFPQSRALPEGRNTTASQAKPVRSSREATTTGRTLPEGSPRRGSRTAARTGPARSTAQNPTFPPARGHTSLPQRSRPRRERPRRWVAQNATGPQHGSSTKPYGPLQACLPERPRLHKHAGGELLALHFITNRTARNSLRHAGAPIG